MHDLVETQGAPHNLPQWRRPVIEKISLEATLVNLGSNIDLLGGSS